MIQFDCPCCACALQVADHFADKVSRCPECRELLRVPAPVVLQAVGTAPRLAGLFAAGIVAVLAAVPVVGAVTLFRQTGTPAAATQPLQAATLSLDEDETPEMPVMGPRQPGPAGDAEDSPRLAEPPAKENSREPLH